MKTLSLATLTGALIFTSSLASAGPRPGPDFFRGHDHNHLRGGFIGPGLFVPGPLARLLPHCVLPSPAVVYAPRAPVVTHRSRVVRVAPAPVAPRVMVNPTSGGGKPSKPDGRGDGDRKPSKPGR